MLPWSLSERGSLGIMCYLWLYNLSAFPWHRGQIFTWYFQVDSKSGQGKVFTGAVLVFLAGREGAGEGWL